jgi:hypothetical protein
MVHDKFSGPFDCAPKLIAKGKASRRSAQGDSEKGLLRDDRLTDTRRLPAGVSFLVPRRRDTEARQGFRAAGRHGRGSESAGIQHSAKAYRKNHMFPGACFVKMSYFVLDFAREMPYPLAPPQGWEAVSIFEK